MGLGAGESDGFVRRQKFMIVCLFGTRPWSVLYSKRILAWYSPCL